MTKLVKGEASLLKQRGAINAFKHGRPLNHGSGPILEFKLEGQDDSITSSKLNGLNWIDWKAPNNKGGITLTYQTEEVNDEETDRLKLFQVALLTDSIKKVRIAQLEQSDLQLDLSLPCIEDENSPPRRQNLKFEFNPVDEVAT